MRPHSDHPGNVQLPHQLEPVVHPHSDRRGRPGVGVRGSHTVVPRHPPDPPRPSRRPDATCARDIQRPGQRAGPRHKPVGEDLRDVPPDPPVQDPPASELSGPRGHHQIHLGDVLRGGREACQRHVDTTPGVETVDVLRRSRRGSAGNQRKNKKVSNFHLPPSPFGKCFFSFFHRALNFVSFFLSPPPPPISLPGHPLDRLREHERGVRVGEPGPRVEEQLAGGPLGLVRREVDRRAGLLRGTGAKDSGRVEGAGDDGRVRGEGVERAGEAVHGRVHKHGEDETLLPLLGREEREGLRVPHQSQTPQHGHDARQVSGGRGRRPGRPLHHRLVQEAVAEVSRAGRPPRHRSGHVEAPPQPRARTTVDRPVEPVGKRIRAKEQLLHGGRVRAGPDDVPGVPLPVLLVVSARIERFDASSFLTPTSLTRP